ncbi:PAS domain-containing protein [Halonotius sp. F2-221B]|uniref:sensor histidine kinase n=1 Tax=Halonotius sp. F2-221B TaxID=2731620 RepID=UPI00398B7017
MGDGVLLSVVVAILIFSSTFVSFGLAAYARYRIDHPVTDKFARLLAAYGLWAGCYLSMLLGPEGLLTRAAVVGQGIAAALSIAAWFAFVIDYTGDSEWIPDFAPRLLWLWAGVHSLLRIVNPNDLLIADIDFGQFGLFVLPLEVYGPYTQLTFLFVLGVLLFTFALLVRFIRRTQSLYRYQATIILAVVAVNTGATLLPLFGIQLHPQLDVTPVLYAGQGVVIWIALYRYDFLRSAPVAADRFFREMADPAVIVDDELTVIEYNEAATQVIGALEKRTALSETDAEGLTKRLQTAIESPETPVEFTTADTPPRVYDLEVTQVTDQFDITQGYVLVLRDITDRKQRERQLEEQNERLEEFADVVSHDLRNPLSTAEGWVAAVTDALDGEEPDVGTAQMGLEHIAHSHDRMDELIDVLLTMARQGQTVADPEPVSLEACATEAWATAETGGMALRVDTDRTVPADPARLRQAFENLFRNANDHSEASTVTVTSTAEGFAVEDDGSGIDPDDREDLFEFGYSTDEDGTGIGLAVVKRIIEAHGWRITVDESDDGGACFEVTGVST